ncbi:hypothetical protein [Myxosarcina sp. GI1]|uniref:hypothetical protein n=1 Tax=Myxosarcina sp. GI1 TaxID=1541065 RepID=UPI000567921E|nr:hypothetical protein [Myxosarcina sp. GI1]
MKTHPICPNCSGTMLHHFGSHREYWFCRRCWQEMPDLETIIENKYYPQKQIVNLSIGLSNKNQPVSV